MEKIVEGSDLHTVQSVYADFGSVNGQRDNSGRRVSLKKESDEAGVVLAVQENYVGLEAVDRLGDRWVIRCNIDHFQIFNALEQSKQPGGQDGLVVE